MENYGDFEEVGDEIQQASGEQVVSRFKMPREGEKIGVILQRFGGNRMEVSCNDGKVRNCRVPGRYSRKLWLRPKDIVLLKPWDFDDGKADIIFKYEGSAINQLKKRGFLDNISDGF